MLWVGASCLRAGGPAPKLCLGGGVSSLHLGAREWSYLGHEEASQDRVLHCQPGHVEGDDVAFPLHLVDDSVGVGHLVPVLQGWLPRLPDHCIDLGLHAGCLGRARISQDVAKTLKKQHGDNVGCLP